jgi:NAD(P)-dependent dehydrogenase (short-subunit alcohol dehydrogenase family)
VVVVTGCSAGLGRATALAFAHGGAWVGLISRNEERLETLKQEIERLGGRALVLPTDVADDARVEAAAQAVEETFGPIDIWVNNAMTSVFSEFIQMMPEEFKRVTEVTYLGVVYGTMSALRRMLPRDRGVIVQVGSALAERSIPLQSAYCGAKHAIHGFTDSIRCELDQHKSKIHLTMVQMPALNTPQFDWVKSRLPRKAQPVPPIFQPEVGADAIVWAARHGKREMRVGWPTVKAFWGNKFIAGWLDDYLGQTCYKGQQTNEPADPDRPNDLWHTVPGNYSAHGRFDDRSSGHSFQVKLVKFFSELGILRAHPVKYLLGAGREASSDNSSRRTKTLVAATAGTAAVLCVVGLARWLGQTTGGTHIKEKIGNRPEAGNQRRLLTAQDLIQNEMAQQAEDLEHGWSSGKEVDQEGGVAELDQDKDRRREAA